MSKGIIYKATNRVNGKVYIGYTTRDFETRVNEHKKEAQNGNQYHFYRAIRSYGWDSFEWKIIDEAETKEELLEKEKYWISFYDSYHNGYNMTKGGEGSIGRTLSEEQKKKISESNKGRKFSEEHRKKLSKTLKGKRKSEDHIKKMSESKKGKRYSSKLTEKDVIKIKKMIIEGFLLKDIANIFNIDDKTVGLIARNKTWKDIVVEGWEEYLNNRKMINPLKEEDVIKIKQLLIEGHREKEIASMFNVSRGTIGQIAQGRTWKDVQVEGFEEYLANKKKKKSA